MTKPALLYLGDHIKWNHDLYSTLEEKFHVVRNEDLDRASFTKALSTGKYGQIVAMYRPFWNTGGEMGNWDAQLIDLLPPSVRIYASAGAGYDWVDTKRLAERGILYCNSAAACTEAVADAAIWLMLSTFRNFSWSSQAARSADASRFTDAHRNVAATAHNPNGHSLGIIGLGNIGYRVAQKAYLAFGMKILYHDVVRKLPQAESSVEALFYDTLDEMLGISDCTVLATPFAGTKVLNESNIAKMKHGSRLVNIARGKLVDEEALVSALNRGQLCSAGLDVHFDEPHVHPQLADMENVQLLSHTAGAAVESHVGFERLGMENIISFFECGKALTPVNAHLIATSNS